MTYSEGVGEGKDISKEQAPLAKSCNLLGTGNYLINVELSKKETCLKLQLTLIPRAHWNSCKIIQEVWVFPLAPGYGPALQRSALLCACWSVQFVGCWSEERNAYYSTRKSIMKRDGPRKGEEKEKNFKTFQISVESGGTDTSDQFFSHILF